MTIAVQDHISDSVRSVCAQQQRLLRRLDSVSHYLDGVCAGMWLPGIDSTFDNPIKKINGRRPVFLTLEVKSSSLNFTGAISRLRNNYMVFSPIFAYDVAMPYAPRGGGRVLPANNLVLARRANELLAALASFGRDVSFGDHDDLQPAVFPQIICDDKGELLEDYSPVLGFALPNPAGTISSVTLTRYNPAAKILARHGLETAAACGHAVLESMVGEFKAEFPEFAIDSESVYKALHTPDATVFGFNVAFETALAHDPQAVANAMRDHVPHKFKFDASYQDLLTAAKNPQTPLKISRFSAVQLFSVETVQDLPADYAGTVLASVDWVPASPALKPIN